MKEHNIIDYNDEWITQILDDYKKTQLKNINPRKVGEKIHSQIKEHGFFSVPMESFSNRSYGLSFHTYQPHNKDHVMLHNHNYFELAYVYKGSCVNVTDDIKKIMHEGDALLMNPQVLHWLYTENETDVVINFMISKDLFESSVVQMLSKNQLFSNFFINYFYQLNKVDNYIFFEHDSALPVKELIQKIVEEYLDDYEFSDNILVTQFLLLFGYLAKGYHQRLTKDEIALADNKVVVDIIQYIHNHLHTVTLDEIAQVFNYSTSHVSRLIRSSLGKTYSEVIQNIRLQTAKDLLESSNLAIPEISDRIGVNDSSYFYRIFKKRYGLTPVQYRNNLG